MRSARKENREAKKGAIFIALAQLLVLRVFRSSVFFLLNGKRIV
jgi:hypothetical protein